MVPRRFAVRTSGGKGDADFMIALDPIVLFYLLGLTARLLRFERERHVHGHLVAVKVRRQTRQRPGSGWIALPSTSTCSKAWMPR